MPSLPKDYAERVYAGVLGKLIGVYLGRPFEGWSYDRIIKHLGEIRFYVHERLNKKLIVTDDDITGTFTFARALADFGYPRGLTAEQIGQTWLNYIIEKKTILWWGGMGVSTEHTAFQRLKNGIPAPKSGSIELNGRVVAEQIGSQIFIDGWALAAPGDPELAADLAKKASSVSHDGEAIHGAVALAVMEALAFNETDLNKLFDEARRFVPADCTIRKMTDDIRHWAASGEDWRKTRGRIEAHYGYDKWGGGCHMIPNHGVIVLALVHGRDDFQESLLVANTAGWDTDCNSGNVGCLLGIKNGLAGIEAGPDWRGPVADRLFLPTADGGRCLTDAVRESYELVRAGCALAGQKFDPPKGGARYHFDLPGAVQGWRFEDSPECQCIGTAWNAQGHSAGGLRSLAIGYCGLAPGRAARAAVPVFVTPEASAAMNTYDLVASPALYSGQTVTARIESDAHNARAADVRLYVRHYDASDQLVYLRSPGVALSAGKDHEFAWRVPDTGGQPIAEVGVEVTSDAKAAGTVYLDWLDWRGAPDLRLGVPGGAPDGTPCGTMWQRAWVASADVARFHLGVGDFRIAQDRGFGLLMQGTREWTGYRAQATVSPHLAKRAGIAVCVQGLERYYALLLSPEGGGKLQLIKRHYGEKVLAEAKFPWAFDQKIDLALATDGGKLRASADGKPVLEATDTAAPYEGGAVALMCEEGCVNYGAVHVKPSNG